MPQIFDNIEQFFGSALQTAIQHAYRADFCIGYFNLRGWKQIDAFIERWAGGKDNCCRLLVGMQRLPQEELRAVTGLIRRQEEIDNKTALRLKKQLAEEFREQLSWGVPTRHTNDRTERTP